jgi:hypothetical protein
VLTAIRIAPCTLLATLALACLAPCPSSAQEEGLPDREPALAQKWEDVLLLDAIRYLRLSPAQMQQVWPLARVAQDRLNRLAGEEARTQAALARIAEKQRRALVAGRQVSLQEQQDALFLNRTMKEKRERANEEIVNYIAPRLARILTREQVQRAFLLAHGEMPKDVPRRPALLDPQSGFVLNPDVRDEWRTAALKQVLYRRYPRQLVDSGVRGLPRMVRIRTAPGATDATAIFLELALAVDDEQAQAPQFPEPLVQSFRKTREFLESRWGNLSALLIQDAMEDELEMALRPLARRMFLSPRLVPVLTERLRQGGQPLPEDDLPEKIDN